jgi:hypothetical protein
LPDFSCYNIPKQEKIYQMAIKYTNWPGMEIEYVYPHLPLQDPPKFTQIWIFGLKVYHLATLVVTHDGRLAPEFTTATTALFVG